MIGMLAKLMKVLNSETHPGQIALAFCFALVAGLTPFFSLHNLVVLFLVLVLRVNLSAFLLSLAFFSGLAYLLDPLFHRLGLLALKAEPLQDFWTAWYNTPYVRLTRFNNTIVMGSLLLSLVLFVPLFLLSHFLIRSYRDHLLALVRRSAIMQVLKGSKFYALYRKYNQARGEG